MTLLLDIEHLDDLLDYRRASGHLLPGEPPTIRVLTGGVSNRTVLVERAGGQAWVLKQALAKLRVAVDWFSSPERIHREALGLRWLRRLAPEGATVRLVCEDFCHRLLVMEAGPQPHQNWKTMLLAGQVEPERVRQFGSLLGTTHRRGHEQRDEIGGGGWPRRCCTRD